MAIVNASEKIQTMIFYKLLDVVPDLLSIEEAGKSKRAGYMDLGFDVLYRSPEKLVIALSHYYRHPSGDMIPDPDMEIAVFIKQEYAEALSFQDAFGYQSVGSDESCHCNSRQRGMNRFLSEWLSNLIIQGHRV